MLAVGVFALAYFSTVDYTDADPAMALLVSQAFLDHGSLGLDPYRDAPELAYDLDEDYRLYHFRGSTWYYSPSVPILSLPFVWLANRFGLHMLDQTDEFATQNLISAVCCALIAVLLYLLCRVFLPPLVSLVVASISVLGSSLMSTLATGLWNACYEIIFLSIALLLLARAEGRGRWLWIAAMGLIAFTCRPIAIFAILAAAAAWLPTGWLRHRRLQWLVPAAFLLMVALVLVLAHPRFAGWFPPYFSPWKLMPRESIPRGLLGSLASPSRGLLVLCPFLLPVVVGAILHFRQLLSDRLFRLAAIWSLLQVMAVAGRFWWGGHCFGPRMLVELMLPAVLVSCLLWQLLAPRTRRVFSAAYVVLGLAAIYVHSVQGLFNTYTRTWNGVPNIDSYPELIFDWRHPQFLASAASIDQRLVEIQRRQLTTYALGDRLGWDTTQAVFRSWSMPEPGWRWSDGTKPEIELLLGDFEERELRLLEIEAGAFGRQQVAVAVNGTAVGGFALEGHAARSRVLVIEPGLLRPNELNTLTFDIPGARASEEDLRLLGIALVSLRISPLTEDFEGVGFDDEAFFLQGFSIAEGGWRWSDGALAAVRYPVGAVAGGRWELELAAGTLGEQRVRPRVNGDELGEAIFSGFDVAVKRFPVDAASLRPFAFNRIELELPDAHRIATDDRLLGVSLHRLRLVRVTTEPKS